MASRRCVDLLGNRHLRIARNALDFGQFRFIQKYLETLSHALSIAYSSKVSDALPAQLRADVNRTPWSASDPDKGS